MVPFNIQEKSSSPKVLTPILSDLYEMQRFIKKIRNPFKKKNGRTSGVEKKDSDIAFDASLLPDSSKIRCPENQSHEKISHGKSCENKSVKPKDDDPQKSRHSPVHRFAPLDDSDSITSTPDLTKTTAQNKHKQWSVSEAVSECARLGEIRREKQIEIVTKVNQAVLAQPEYFYDFCIVSSEEDYEEANSLKDKISTDFNLRGCMIYEDDFFSLGRDSFEAYERMMDRSTKIFFYISDSLNESAFCRRLQSGSVFQSLMSKARREKEKCVPVFPRGICRVPLPLSGIGGLEIPNRSLTAQRLRITYKEDVRQHRILQEQERWKHFFFKTLSEELEKFLHSDKHNGMESDTESSDSDDDDFKERGKNFTSAPRKQLKSQPSSGFLSGVQEFLQNATSSPVVTSSEVNIDSNTAHVGHNITIHVHCRNSHSDDDDMLFEAQLHE